MDVTEEYIHKWTSARMDAFRPRSSLAFYAVDQKRPFLPSEQRSFGGSSKPRDPRLDVVIYDVQRKSSWGEKIPADGGTGPDSLLTYFKNKRIKLKYEYIYLNISRIVNSNKLFDTDTPTERSAARDFVPYPSTELRPCHAVSDIRIQVLDSEQFGTNERSEQFGTENNPEGSGSLINKIGLCMGGNLMATTTNIYNRGQVGSAAFEFRDSFKHELFPITDPLMLCAMQYHMVYIHYDFAIINKPHSFHVCGNKKYKVTCNYHFYDTSKSYRHLGGDSFKTASHVTNTIRYASGMSGLAYPSKILEYDNTPYIIT